MRFLFWCQLRPEMWDEDSLSEVEDMQTNSPFQLLIECVLDLDYRLHNRYHIDLADVPADEYIGHRVLVEERRRKEDDDRAQQEQENNIKQQHARNGVRI